MGPSNDLLYLLKRLKINIDSLIFSCLDADEVRKNIRSDLRELQSRSDHIVRTGSDCSLVEVCAIASIHTGYTGQRLANLLGNIAATISYSWSWESAQNDPLIFLRSVSRAFIVKNKSAMNRWILQKRAHYVKYLTI